MTYIPEILNARLAADAVTTDKVLNATLTDADVNASNIDGAAGTPSLRTLGSGAGQALAGNTTLDAISAPTGTVDMNSQQFSNLAAATTNGEAVEYSQYASLALDNLPASPTGSVDMNSQQFTGLAAADAAGEAVEYNQFIAAIDGRSWKEPVEAASTANLTLSGEQTIDGQSLVTGDRVLVKDQSTAADNGIYVVDSGAWSRASDADSGDELDDGATVWVKAGSANGDRIYTQVNTVPTVGGSAQSWAITGSATSVSSMSDLSDANTSSAVDGSILRYESSAGEWQATTAANMLLNDTGQLQLPATGASGGIVLGGDWSIYRSAAGTATIPSNNLIVGNELTSGSKFTSNGGRQVDLTSISGNTSLSAQNNDFVLVDTSGGAVTVTLPASHTAGAKFEIKRNGANDVTVATSDADTIDGGADFTLDVDLMAVTVVSDGANWQVF